MSPFDSLPDFDGTCNGLHVALIVGTRPEAIKLAPVALALQARPEVRVSIWCTGQHPAWATEMLDHFRLTPTRVLNLPPNVSGLTQLCSAMMSQLQVCIEQDRPDVVIVQGDTSSAFAGTLAAAYAEIPVVHVEAGLRSNDRRMPFPEDAHRRAIAQFTSLHCAPTRQAAATLISEGVDAADVLQTGNTVIDALKLISTSVPANDPVPMPDRTLILVTCHRRETWGDPYKSVCSAVQRLARRGDCDIVFVLHPNPQLMDVAHGMLRDQPRVRLVPPLGYPEFMRLLKRAVLVLTDSGGVQEEAAALGTPILVMRDTTERPEGVQAGVARLVGTGEETIVSAVSSLLDQPAGLEAMRIPCDQYGDGFAGNRIAAAVLARWMPSQTKAGYMSAAAAAIGSSNFS